MKTSNDKYRTDVIKKFKMICDSTNSNLEFAEDSTPKNQSRDCVTYVNRKFLTENFDHKGALMSWGYEMSKLLDNQKKVGLVNVEDSSNCQVNIRENVIFLKIDAGIKEILLCS